jgi:hypothetical protein
MKRQATILFLFLVSLSCLGQKFIKTETPCAEEVLFKTPGRWLNTSSNYYINNDGLNLQSNQIKEVTNRVDAIHELIAKIYTQPMGIDAAWYRTLSAVGFAEQFRIGRDNQGRLEYNPIKKKTGAAFGYVCGFFPYACSNTAHEIWRGYPGETGTWFSIWANTLTAAIKRLEDDEITIDGYPVCTLMPLIKKFGDFELLGIDEPTYRISTGGRNRYVIIHRKGILPYIPVTRKQYLEKCIPYTESFWDKSIKTFEDMPEQEGKNEQLKKLKQGKDEALRKYQEELEKTTKEGLLDAPAIVQFLWVIDPQDPIFTDEKNGWRLVIQNPDYMRSDLPKYVPQLLVVSWTWNDWKPQADLARLIEEKFPFDQLQVMIDK